MGWTGIIFSLTAGDLGKKSISQLTKTSQSTSYFNTKYLGNIAGMIASLGSILITYPFEYAYVRLVTDKQPFETNGEKNLMASEMSFQKHCNLMEFEVYIEECLQVLQELLCIEFHILDCTIYGEHCLLHHIL